MPYLTLCMKEIKSYFKSPMAYLLSSFFLFILGVIFYQSLHFAKEQRAGNIDFEIIRPIFGNINFLLIIIIPLITMRSFSEEKKEGTLNLLYLSSLTHMDIIWGKFMATLAVVFFMIFLTLIFPFILFISGYSNPSLIFMGYLGILLNSTVYLSVGLFVSTLTENQIVSALITFSILIFFILLSQASYLSTNFMIAQMIKYTSIVTHFSFFTRGVFLSSGIIYYSSFIFFFLYLTKKSLDSRFW